MGKPDGERIATLEQKMIDFSNKLDTVAEDIKEIKNSLVMLVDFEGRLKRLEAASNLWKFLAPTLAAVAGAALTFLLIEYIKNLK